MAHLGQVAYTDAEVEKIQAMGTVLNGVDQTVLCNTMFSNGSLSSGQKGMLQFYVTGAANTEERVTIQGSKGRIILDGPAHVPIKIRVCIDAVQGKTTEQLLDFSLPDDSVLAPWNYPGSIGFTYKIEEVCKALRRGDNQCSQFNWDHIIQLAAMIDEMISHIHGNSEADDGEEKIYD